MEKSERIIRIPPKTSLLDEGDIAENIYILFLAVTAEKPLDIAVVYRIYYLPVLWVMRAYRSVNRHSNSLSDI